MKEIVQEVLEYFRENLVVTLVIALIAGFAARKTVAHGEKGNFALYFIVGLLGSFLGQYAILYFGLKEIMEELAAFRLVFDFLAAYIGSFILAALIHFIKPN
jgi:uncharacterized membrane protein YeaQ/YmgE (transglycosylase-associated protein family)